MSFLPSFRQKVVAQLCAPGRASNRLIILNILAGYFSILLLGHFLFGDYVEVWRKIGVFSLHPVFADLSAVTGAGIASGSVTTPWSTIPQLHGGCH